MPCTKLGVGRVMLQTSSLQDLIDLAKEPSSDKRRELMRKLTDVFLDSAPDYSDAERDHFGAILGRVANDMDAAVRRQLAKQFANVPSAPHNLIQRLAADEEFSVAKDVLLKSTVLRDDDLIAIARHSAQDKLEVIAARHSVSEAVSEAIVEHGDDQVVVKLVQNTGAALSRSTIRRVVERSETSDVLQAPLITRADVPPDMLQDMFSFVSSELRTKITQKLDSLPPEVIEKAFAAAAREFAGEVRQVKDADRKAMVYVAEMARRKLLNEALLHQLLRNNQVTEFIHAFARLGEIDVKTAARIVNACNAEGVAVVCRATRFDRSTFAAIAFFLEERANDTQKGMHNILELYDKVTPEAAQRVMRFWRVRKEASDTPVAKAS
ncbi:MAG: DUF2336 domain-containing protein [Alphaproteobacteria bacterium]|nr:DUF2336 domain-containing protein [Alphaproteobacteria bacterium]